MRKIDVVFNGREYRFMSNDDGSYLFIDCRQISCDSGFRRLSRMKNWIRYHLYNQYRRETCSHERPPRISFKPDSSEWI